MEAGRRGFEPDAVSGCGVAVEASLAAVGQRQKGRKAPILSARQATVCRKRSGVCWLPENGESEETGRKESEVKSLYPAKPACVRARPLPNAEGFLMRADAVSRCALAIF